MMLCIRGHGGLHSNTAKQHNTGGVKTEVTATLERHAQSDHPPRVRTRHMYMCMYMFYMYMYMYMYM